MKIILRRLKDGKLKIDEVPRPSLEPGCALVQVHYSAVSSGTERAALELGKSNLLKKAKNRPDELRRLLQKIKTEGAVSSLKQVWNRLDTWTPLGYSCAGVVLAVGPDVRNIMPGDSVACAGGEFANHAEIVSIPQNLIVKVPSTVSLEDAAFTTLGAVAISGVRLTDVRFGDVVGVIGIGLIGALTVQVLKAAGCRVVGFDINSERANFAFQIGADGIASTAEEFSAISAELSSGNGLDAVIITADTPSSEPLSIAARVARDRAVVVAVGAVGTSVPRRLFYDKELDFRISRSYGPGRYDPSYEEKGQDYPIGYVRWTENRNMQAFIGLLSERKLSLGSLVTHKFPISQGLEAYELVTGNKTEPFLGVLIEYPDSSDKSTVVTLSRGADSSKHGDIVQSGTSSKIGIGFLGAGSFANLVLLPAFKKSKSTELIGVCTSSGVSSKRAGDKYGFRYCTTDQIQLLEDAEIDAVVIATRHHLHAAQITSALRAGKHVFCEKPLCLTQEELKQVIETLEEQSSKLLFVGYNRRYAPLGNSLAAHFRQIHEPLMMTYRINAGYIPKDHWVQDPEQGGGRMLGEICHFVDFLNYIVQSSPARVYARALPNNERYREDNLILNIEYLDGSIGTVIYEANGSSWIGKERIEISGGGSTGIIDDFRSLEIATSNKRKAVSLRSKQDKGHEAEIKTFLDVVSAKNRDFSYVAQLVDTSLTIFRALDSLSSGIPQDISSSEFLLEALGRNHSAETSTES